MLYVGEGSKREQWHLLCSLPAFSHFPCYPQAKWDLLVLIPMWLGFCNFLDPVGLSKELSCEAGSFSYCCLNPQGVFNQWFEALFFRTGALGLHSLFRFLFVSPGLSAHECGTTQSANYCLA